MSNLNTEAYLRAKGIIDSEPIDNDHPCPSCGYNLCGLKYGGKCPECGTAIERYSYGYDHFMDAPIAYMKMIRWGMGLISLGFWLFTGTTLRLILTQQRDPVVLFMIFLTGCCMEVGGLWLITKRRPVVLVCQPNRITMRGALRILSIAACILLAMEWLVVMYQPKLPVLAWWFLTVIGDTTAYAMGALAAWLLSDYARWVHDDELSSKFDTVIGLFVLLWILEMMLYLFGGTIPFLFNIMILVAFGTYIWYFINIARLFDLVNRAVRDKPGYDANVLRDPEKILR